MEIEADPNPDSRPVLLAGTMLGLYRIESLIGRGGMGEVYLARDERLQRPVAIKRIRLDRSLDAQHQERFRREALAVAQLSHPAIVQVYEWLDTAVGNCLVMEWIGGGNLAKLIASGELDLRRALQLACQIADGLKEAHSKGFLHRDLKPENVLVTTSGHAKIVDFGLAVPIQRFTDEPENALTRPGVILGTIYTMSPEQARGRKLDPRSDLFSFGCILYEMLCGRSPFRAKAWVDTLHNILSVEPEPLNRPDLPGKLVELVSSLLAKDRDQRPASAEEVHRILESCLLAPEAASLHPPSPAGEGDDPPMAPTAVEGLPGKAPAAAYPERAGEPAPAPAPLFGSETTSTSLGRPRPGFAARTLIAVGVVLLLAIGAAKSGIWRKDEASTRKSRNLQILVLPFKDETGESQPGAATAATDEMARLLGRIEGLDVLAGMVAEPYSQKNFPTLKKELEGQVDYLLTGKVYRSGGIENESLQVSVELARLQDGSQVWSARFGTSVDGGPLLPEAERKISEIETKLGLSSPVVKAENAYRKALEYRRQPGYSKENLVRAVELLKLAVREDPKMVAAWAELAIAQSLLCFNGDLSEDWAAGAANALSAASRLEPRAPEVRLATAFVEFRVYHRFKNAKTLFEEFVADYPNDAEGLVGLGYAERRLGLLADACSHFEAAYRIKPTVDRCIALAETYRARRRWQQAHRYYQEAAAFDPEATNVHAALARNLFDWKGSAKEARDSLASFVHDRSGDLLSQWLKLDLYSGSYFEALDRYSSWSNPPEIDRAQNSWLVTRAAHLLGKEDQARQLNLENRAYLLERVAANKANSWDRTYLALTQAYFGEADKARRAMARAIEVTPYDEFTGPRFLEGKAEMEILLGDQETAMKLLRALLQKEYQHPISLARLRFDPAWAPLRSNPEFAGWIASQ